MKPLSLLLFTTLIFSATHDLYAQQEALKILANGNVGIGTSNPTRRLEINNALKLTNQSANNDDGVIGANTYLKGLDIVGIDVDNERRINIWGGIGFCESRTVYIAMGLDGQKNFAIGAARAAATKPGDWKPSFIIDRNAPAKSVVVKSDGAVDVAGKVTAKDYALTGAGANGPIPSGGIIMWSGDVNKIPEGWHLCDGTNNTPDLRDRFVLGAGAKYKKGDKGGQEKVALTAAQLPKHTHSIKNNGSVQDAATAFGGSPFVRDGDENGKKTSDCSDCKGEAHENMPPYYALAYIMKL